MNEFQIQRLIDGECDEETRTMWLSSIGDDVDTWRRISLGFLQDQALRQCFREESFRQHISCPVEDACDDWMEMPVASHDRCAHKVDFNDNISLVSHQQNHSWSVMWIAVTLFGLVVGFSMIDTRPSDDTVLSANSALNPDIQPPFATIAPTIENGSAANAALVSDSDRSVIPAGSVRLVSNGESGAGVDLPVYKVPALSTEMLNQWMEPDEAQLIELNSQLNPLGWQAGINTQFLQGKLDDGRQIVLPLNVVHVQSLSY